MAILNGTGTSSSSSCFSITKSDTVALAYPVRGIYVGGAGDLALVLEDDTDTVTFVGVLAGTILPLRAEYVMAATTATNLVGLR